MTNLIEAHLIGTGCEGHPVYIRCTTVESFTPNGPGTAIRAASGEVYFVSEPIEFIADCVTNSSVYRGPDIMRYDSNDSYTL